MTRGLCNKHYLRLRAAEAPEIPKRTCSVDGCEEEHNSRGYCKKHYKRFQRNGNTLTTRGKKSCSVDGCEGKHEARGYCARHYKQRRKYDDVSINNRQEKGGRGD